MTTPRLTIVVAAVAILSVIDHAGLFGRQESDQSRYGNAVATVVHVADGDTFDIDIPDSDADVTRIRLWGVDCPEIAHRIGDADDWFGRDAADFVQEHLEGRRIRIALDPNRPTRGKYGRLLAYAYFEDTNEMLNEVLLQEGLAYADRRFDHIFALRFRDLEKRAAKAKRGLWESVEVSQMPSWRQRMLDAGVIRGR
ncbi:MAG: thermonuclease family protein [Phycisphaerales bacterium]|nr:thermonuclease family protein [Phycisphaerales bacterium]MCB9857017.1 thermonuclease family protein [Phycisphaerales bacterium]MCB9861856.1 thermonuclease family protein [Phycisphaerales bacterium]